LTEPKDQLPLTLEQAEVVADQRALKVVPAWGANVSHEAARRYAKFFNNTPT
jgi:hypothetical protein